MNLSRWAVGRPVTTCMIFIAVVVLGIVGLRRLAIDLLPDIDFPSITVFTSYPGVGPEEIETLITRPIEQVVSRVQGVERIESFSTEGRARVMLRFAWGTVLDAALADVRAEVERARADFPDEAEPPIVFKFDLASFPIMMLALSGDLEPWRLRLLADETISYRLERLVGVAAAEVRGGQKREIHVELDAERLAAHGLTAAQVAEALRRENVNLPAGDVRERGVEVIVRTLGEFQSVAAMRKVVVAVRNGTPVRVGDLGGVRDAYEDPLNAVMIDGKPGIRIGVSKLPGANTVEVAERVRAEIARINADMPGIELRPVVDTSTYIENAIGNVEQGLMWGSLLAVLVLLVFLRSVRSTMIIGAVIPIALIGTFALMFYFDFTLNLITFGGLALGLGMLVDNSIVILENIERHRAGGLGPTDAAVRGAGEVATAISASTLTTLCVFVPVIFIGGFAGIFFGQMAFVVTFSLTCALAVALMLVPVFSSWSRGSAATSAAWFGRFEEGFAGLVRRAIAAPAVVFGTALTALLVSLALATQVGTELLTQGDQGEVQVNAELPVGTPLEGTMATIRAAQAVVDRVVPEQASTMAIAGPPGFWSSSGANAASLSVSLVPVGERERSAEDVAAALRRELGQIPDFQPRVRAGERFWLFRMLRGGGERLSVEVRGFDTATGMRLAREVTTLLESVRGVTDTEIDQKEGAREAVVVIDADKAADLGLSVAQVGDAVSTYVLGKAATYYREGGDEFRVLVRLRPEDRERAVQLDQLPLVTPLGQHLTLGNIARIDRREGPGTIRRLNQERIITVSAGYADRDLGEISREIGERLAGLVVPEGFTVTLGGELEEQRKAFAELIIGLILSLLLVYMVMASLFESLIQPFLMLLSIPFLLVGAVLTMVLTGTTLNVNSFLGIIVLVGVVVNNAIVLVDYTNLLRREAGLGLTEAVVEGARRRLRPIVLTTLTTVLALLPVAIGVGEGSELQAPLARVVAGGLAVSSLITLFFVPTLYFVVERRRERRREAAGGGSA